jgi:hypothetical protein
MFQIGGRAILSVEREEKQVAERFTEKHGEGETNAKEREVVGRRRRPRRVAIYFDQ